MIAMLIASLAIPGAFEDDAVLFALRLPRRAPHAHRAVRGGTEHVDVRAAARALALTATLAPLLLLVATALDGTAQVAIWIVALALDYAGGGLRGIGGWRLSPGHFAERHSLIVIIALGESIVAIGVGAKDITLGAGELLAAALGVSRRRAVVGLLRRGARARRAAAHAQPEGRARNAMARDAFSFLHLPIVAGIVLLALGVKKTLEHVDDELKLIAALGLCGGVALDLLADVAFRRRCLGCSSCPGRRRGRVRGAPARHRDPRARGARAHRRHLRRARGLRVVHAAPSGRLIETRAMRVVAGRLSVVVVVLCALLAGPAQAAEPAQTLTAGDRLRTTSRPAGYTATATLAAAPSPAQDAFLVLYVGKRESGRVRRPDAAGHVHRRPEHGHVLEV